MRVSIYWAPLAEPGDTTNVDPQYGISWDKNDVVKVGGTFDWSTANGANPQFRVAQHSAFKSAYDYHLDSSGKMGPSSNPYIGTYEGWGKSWQYQDGLLKSNTGAPLTLPRRVGSDGFSNTVDVKYFFTQDSVLNEVIVLAKEGTDSYTKAQRDGNWGVGCLNKEDFKAGIYKNEYGFEEYGMYVLIAEPGIYQYIRGVYTAYTLRDALAWGKGNTAVSWANNAVAYIANALHLEGNQEPVGIGLKYQTPKVYTGNMVQNFGNHQHLKDTMGVGLVWFPPEQPQTQITNYYYVLKEGEYGEPKLEQVAEPTDGEEPEEPTKKSGVIYSSAFERTANTADEELVPSKYEAPSKRKKNVGGTEYEFTLLQGYLESVEEVGGYMDIGDTTGSLQFVNKSGTPEITYALKQFIGNDALTQVDMKKWANARATATSVEEMKRVSGLDNKYAQIHSTGEGTIAVDFGASAGKAQANFLYVYLPDGQNPPPTESDPPDIDIITVKPGTFVTKMYYESEEDTTPSKVKSEPISRDSVYKVPPKEDMYQTTDWATIPDKTMGVPEPFDTYEEATSDSVKSGTGGTTLQPDSWSDPDTELFIKLVKQPAEKAEATLVLPEKRISWLKDLSHIGGIPTITFEWEARDGEETHYCGGHGDNPCSGHACNEGIGKDNVLNFLSSNLKNVDPVIIGNAAGFFPYDEANEKKHSPGKDAGSYLMNPNYGYVIWRGQDIPTIASYKYGNTTGNEVSDKIPGVISLLGDNMIGIEPKGARHANNHASYNTSFSFTIGKSNYDCTRYAAFQEAFGDREIGDAKVDELVEQKHELWDSYDKKVEVYKQAQADYARLKAEYEEEYGSIEYNAPGKYEGLFGKKSDKVKLYNQVKTAETVMKNAEKDKLNTATNFNSVSAMLGLTNSPLSEGDAASEKLDINIGDYDFSSKWSYCGKENWYTASGDNKDFNVDVRVDVEYGNPNLGDNKVEFKSENLTAKGENFTHVQGFPVNNTKPIGFYPYVEMWYDTTAGKETNKVVYTLGGHKSQLIPQDYVEIGYLPKSANAETKTGLVLQSKQWSTHQAAVKGLSGNQKNKVLPGGAIYRLQTPGAGENGNTRTKVAMSSWLTYLPTDTINATVEGKDVYNIERQNDKNEKLFREVMNSLNSLDIVQIVGNNANPEPAYNGTMVDQVQAGTQRVPNTSGQPTSPDMKYWMKQDLKDGSGTAGVPSTNEQAMKVNSVHPAEADLDIISQVEERIYYRVYSDVQGNVYVSKSLNSEAETMAGKGTILGTITKEQGLDALLAQNTEIKALNNRTKIVENFLKSIDRNTGKHDTGADPAVTDAKWYNEAWDGVCVVRINKVIEIGFKDNDANKAARTAAIDTKLQPPRTSQGDLYKKGVYSWFETDKRTNYSSEPGYVGTFDSTETGAGQVKVAIKDMNSMYRSKWFIIPNASVMDLY